MHSLPLLSWLAMVDKRDIFRSHSTAEYLIDQIELVKLKYSVLFPSNGFKQKRTKNKVAIITFLTPSHRRWHDKYATQLNKQVEETPENNASDFLTSEPNHRLSAVNFFFKKGGWKWNVGIRCLQSYLFCFLPISSWE